MMMASILLAAGVFTGIMQGSGMLGAMASAAVAIVPRGPRRHVPFALGLVSMPFSLLFDPTRSTSACCPWSREPPRLLGRGARAASPRARCSAR